MKASLFESKNQMIHLQVIMLLRDLIGIFYSCLDLCSIAALSTDKIWAQSISTLVNYPVFLQVYSRRSFILTEKNIFFNCLQYLYS